MKGGSPSVTLQLGRSAVFCTHGLACLFLHMKQSLNMLRIVDLPPKIQNISRTRDITCSRPEGCFFGKDDGMLSFILSSRFSQTSIYTEYSVFRHHWMETTCRAGPVDPLSFGSCVIPLHLRHPSSSARRLHVFLCCRENITVPHLFALQDTTVIICL